MRFIVILLILSLPATAQIRIVVDGNSTSTYEPRITAPNTVHKYLNGYKQFVDLNTDSIPELTNQYFTNLRARGAISLTTLGTSGAATYNSTTGIFNIPQYSVSGSGMRVYNVEDYGAVHDGVTDDTQAIQAAINACEAAGGGIVYFPNGIYIIAGALQTSVGGLNMNAQIYIPARGLNTGLKTHIVLLGETPPNFTQGINPLIPSDSLGRKGVILKSTLTTGATRAAVIGTNGPAPYGYNYNYLTVQNIFIQVKNNPSGAGPVVGGICWKHGSALQVNNVVVHTDTTDAAQVRPTNDIVGIETADNSSENGNFLQSVEVGGFRTGLTYGEHVVTINVRPRNCYYGYEIKAGYHNLVGLRMGAPDCAIPIYVTGFCYFWIFLDVQKQALSLWNDTQYLIKDSANLANGTIIYHIVTANVGVTETGLTKSGAANVNTYCITDGFANLAAATNTFTYNGTNNLFINTSSSTGKAAIGFQRSTTTKWGMGLDYLANGTNDFYLNDVANGKARFYINTTGDVSIGGTANSSPVIKAMNSGAIILPNISEYADNAAAVSAGLAVGTIYRTGDALKIVH